MQLNRSGSVGRRVATSLWWGLRQCNDNDYQHVEQHHCTDSFLHEFHGGLPPFFKDWPERPSPNLRCQITKVLYDKLLDKGYNISKRVPAGELESPSAHRRTVSQIPPVCRFQHAGRLGETTKCPAWLVSPKHLLFHHTP